MRTIRLFVITMLSLSLVAVSGCVTRKYDPNTFQLPKRVSTDHGMIFGRIDMKDENRTLWLTKVAMQRQGAVYFHMGNVPTGEESFVTTNNYFVVPNVKSGRYLFGGFETRGIFHSLHTSEDEMFSVGPGEIYFIGSYDYTLEQEVGFGRQGEYSLEKAKKPSELDLLQWLYQSSLGTGWEEDIAQRIRKLGSKPKSRAVSTAGK